MSLLLPTQMPGAASTEAAENIHQLERVDLRGGKEQVATRVALECLKRMEELHPGYLEGIKSWVKAGCVYTLGGAAAAGAIGLSGWGLDKCLGTQYWPQILMAVGVTEVTANVLGFRSPVTALAALLFMSVRDAANRAAKWSQRGDERSIEEKERESKDCHRTILSQLSKVYDDCGQKLHEMAEKSKTPEEILSLQTTALKLEEQIPAIKKLLQPFNLANYEMEEVLQKLCDSIRYVQMHVGQLKPDQESNANLLAECPLSLLGKIAVPLSIQERLAAAKASRLTWVKRLSGYGESLLTGGKTALGLTALAAIAAAGVVAGVSIYQNGWGAGASKALKAMFSPNISDGSNFILAGSASVAFFAGAAGREGLRNYRVNQSNGEYVQSEIDHCKEDLKAIYDGIQYHLDQKLAGELMVRLPQINQAIRDLGFNPDEITGNLAVTLGGGIREPGQPYHLTTAC